jgi:anthranilate phosphoribosyltransferase
MRELLDEVCAGRNLTREAAAALFGKIVRGELKELEICALLVALKTKGETAAEIAGAAEALRSSALAFDTSGIEVADTCGTGGDGAGTINVSTAAALVVAEAGVPVAKHGNRSVSSRCGSADVLEQSGVRIDTPPSVSSRCLAELGVCFLFAPLYHAGIRHAMPVRRGLGVRTIFNLVGPLANPARPAFQLVGVFDERLCATLAETLGLLGCRRALVVHGSGLDEIALHAETRAALLTDGKVEELVLTPEQAGLQRHAREDLAGGDSRDNAASLQATLSGRGPDAHRDAVALNAGALLWLAGRAENLASGAAIAREVIASGRAASRLGRLVEMTCDA